MKNVNQTIVETFREVAEYLETGRSGRRPRLLLTGMGSEHGEENSMQAAVMAARVGRDVSYIGTLEGEGVTTVPVADEEAGHRKMVELLESGAADAAVTMHFPFPIGVSTVGRVVTPARGKSMFLATTTGTSSDFAKFTALPTIMATSSWGADTVPMPSTGNDWKTVRNTSEVPGGMSTNM